MSHMLYQVDAFTSEPFKGNPAAVCLLTGPKSDQWMQSLASEMNLSETAFLLPDGEGWRLRWFTPTAEVDLCGHATLASAMVLFTTQPVLREKPLKFETLSGELLARWAAGAIELDFPVMVFNHFSVDSKIEAVLGFSPVEAVCSGNYYLFEAANESLIRSAQPDMDALKKLPMLEVIITAKSESVEFDFISRFFAPQLGIDEDPVTGSAHCLLAPYWADKLGQTTLKAFQASQRGGSLQLQLADDRVRITGEAIIIFKADLLI